MDENVRLAVVVLQGRGERPREDVIYINAGNLLYLGGLVANTRDGYYAAKSSVKSGRPYEKLLEFVNATNGDRRKLAAYAVM